MVVVKSNKLKLVVLLGLFIFLPFISNAQHTLEDLKSLSLEELMNIEVISVAKRPQNLWESPSSVQVVKGDELANYGASNIPESLYLFGNLQVAQKGSHSFGIAARGFNTELSNKLLVLMDGRTLYTPLYSGVYWERQDYLLTDIDQIEVISGPGGTLWGANAVNGVINITTKRAADTQGFRAELGAGNELKAIGSLRYGGKISDKTYFRVYGKYTERDQSVFPDSVAASDDWKMGQGGFRVDSEISSDDVVTFQGDIYNTEVNSPDGTTGDIFGANLLARWSHTFSDRSQFRLQSYFDHTNWQQPTAPYIINDVFIAPEGEFKDKLNTIDIDFQHQWQWGNHSHIVWGGGYRHLDNTTTNAPSLGFLPAAFDQNLYNIFIQDEITIMKNMLVTIGTKLEYNPYTKYVWEPSGRIQWNLKDKRIIWGAVSRAVRTPSRVDTQLTQATPPNFVLLKGNPDFQSEILLAYELGFRTQLGDRGTAAVATYFNNYDDVRSTVLDPVNIFPLTFQNGLQAESYGLEVSINYQVNEWWQLYTGYNLMRQNLWLKEGEFDFSNTHNETADPDFQLVLRSSFQIPSGVTVNTTFRWVDDLPINNAGVLDYTPAYAELDARVAWKLSNNVSLSIAGRNLLHNEHAEYGIPGRLRALQRSVYGSVTLNF